MDARAGPAGPLAAERAGEVRWCAMRWKLETFHTIPKPGCRAEKSQRRSAERIASLVAWFCIIAWRIPWLILAQGADP